MEWLKKLKIFSPIAQVLLSVIALLTTLAGAVLFHTTPIKKQCEANTKELIVMKEKMSWIQDAASDAQAGIAANSEKIDRLYKLK